MDEAERKHVTGCDPELPYGPYSTYVCPFCSQEELYEVKQCVHCDRELDTVHFSISADDTCLDCLEALMEKTRKILQTQLTPQEYEAIRDYLDLDAKNV